MKILNYLLVGIFFTSNFFAQENVKWSELMPAKGLTYDILPVSYGDFYTLKRTGGVIFGSNTINHHLNFKISSKTTQSSKLDKGVGKIESYKVINGYLHAFISDKKDGQNIMYVQKYDEALKRVGLPKELCSYTSPKGFKTRDYYFIQQSENRDYFVIVYSIPGRKEEYDRFGFVIYNSEFEEHKRGEYEIPYEANYSSITNALLTNSGDYFVSAKIYKKPEKKIFNKKELSIDKIVFYHVNNEQQNEFNISELAGKYISDFNFSSNNINILNFSGIYSKNGNNTADGLFYVKFDYIKGEMVSSGHQEFGKDFITEDWTERQKEKAEKREQKGRGEPTLYEYDIRKIKTLEDGSMIGVLEQYYVTVHTRTNSQGQTTTTYTYYYNDLIVYKINKDGEFDFLKKIYKRQVSTNDGGKYSSFASYLSNGKLNIIFNDRALYYDESGNYKNENAKGFYTKNKRSNVVCIVDVDINSGDFERKAFFTGKEVDAYAIPKMFQWDEKNNEMLMYLVRGKKEKFGVFSPSSF